MMLDGAPHDVKTENNHYLNTSEKIMEATEKAEAGGSDTSLPPWIF